LKGGGLDIVHGDADVIKAAPAATTVQVFRKVLESDTR
jgi:hypothetical protein